MLLRATLGIAGAIASAPKAQHTDQRYSARRARLMREVSRPCPKGRDPRAWAAMQRAAGVKR